MDDRRAPGLSVVIYYRLMCKGDSPSFCPIRGDHLDVDVAAQLRIELAPGGYLRQGCFGIQKNIKNDLFFTPDMSILFNIHFFHHHFICIPDFLIISYYTMTVVTSLYRTYNH